MSIESIRVSDPAERAAGDTGDAKCDVVLFAEFGFAGMEKFGESAVDVAEAEEAEVEGADGIPRG
jgi:hypothetical protein